MSRADPKHGRWILPLVIAGLIGFTYLFVNALPPAPETTTDTTSPDGASDTTQPVDDGVTTTLSPQVTAFLTAVDDLATRTAAMATEAEEVNTAWDERTATSAETSDALTDLAERSEQLADEIAALEVPQRATNAWTGVIQSSIEFSEAGAAMLDGFANQPGSEGRLAALDQYTAAAASMATGYDAARAAVS